MNKLKLNQFNGITEFKNELKSDDIKIWIYTLHKYDIDVILTKDKVKNKIREFFHK